MKQADLFGWQYCKYIFFYHSCVSNICIMNFSRKTRICSFSIKPNQWHTLIPQIIWKKEISRLKIVCCSVFIKKKNQEFTFFPTNRDNKQINCGPANQWNIINIKIILETTEQCHMFEISQKDLGLHERLLQLYGGKMYC